MDLAHFRRMSLPSSSCLSLMLETSAVVWGTDQTNRRSTAIYSNVVAHWLGTCARVPDGLTWSPPIRVQYNPHQRAVRSSFHIKSRWLKRAQQVRYCTYIYQTLSEYHAAQRHTLTARKERRMDVVRVGHQAPKTSWPYLSEARILIKSVEREHHFGGRPERYHF